MIPIDRLTELTLAGSTALAITYLATPVVRRIALWCGCVDRPLTDRWSRRLVARLGGVALFIGVSGAGLLWVDWHPPMTTLLIGCALVFTLGLIDDFRRMAPYTKLVGQLAVGTIVVIGGVRIELVPWPWTAMLLSVFWLVLVINAFNLLDNMDGLAAGVGAIAAAFCAIHAALIGQWEVATLGAIVSGCALGFLRFNFPPAKIFMGDSGSHLLGLSLGALALLGTWQHSTQLLSVLAVPMLLLAVPIFDTCFVTIQRLVNAQHPFRGGTDHVSHRLTILGLSQRQTALTLYGLSIGLGLMSLASYWLRPMAVIVMWLLALTTLLLGGASLARVKVYQLQWQPVSGAPGGGGGSPATFIETMLLHKRRLLEVLIDFTLICAAYVGAYLLRFEGTVSPDVQQLIVQSLPVVVVAQLVSFAGLGLYRGIWRYVSLSDLVRIAKAVTLGTVCSSVAVLYLWRFEGYSRAAFIIDGLLLLLLVSGSRAAERLLSEWIGSVAARGAPVLIIGAGDTGELVVRHLKRQSPGTHRVIGFLDDDMKKQGSRIHGLPVLGTRRRLPDVLALYQVREVLVAVRQPSADLVRDVQRSCEPQGIAWRVVAAPWSGGDT